MTTNSATAIFNGDLVALGVSAAGQPTALAATPTTSTVGLVGVCVGVRYQLSGQQLGYPLYAQYLPANAVTSGLINIFIRVVEDPDQLYQVQSQGSVGYGSIGKTAALANFGGSTTTGNSTIALSSTIANTSALAVKIVDLVNSSSTFGGNFPSNPGDAYTDCIVKLNFGVHSYYQSAGTTN
jgi:hypothetical protein